MFQIVHCLVMTMSLPAFTWMRTRMRSGRRRWPHKKDDKWNRLHTSLAMKYGPKSPSMRTRHHTRTTPWQRHKKKIIRYPLSANEQYAYNRPMLRTSVPIVWLNREHFCWHYGSTNNAKILAVQFDSYFCFYSTSFCLVFVAGFGRERIASNS